MRLSVFFFCPACVSDEVTTVRPLVNVVNKNKQDTCEADVGDNILQDIDEALVPKMVTDVVTPTSEEVRLHNLTHMPPRSWCHHCVAGKGVELDSHLSQRSPGCVPCVHADYMFMGEKESQGTTPILVIKDDVQKSVSVNVVPSKGG